MSKNICFVANQKKTVFFRGIAQELAKVGVSVYWITVSDKLKRELEVEYGEDKVLLLSRGASGDPIANFRLNEIIFGDRSLKEQQVWAHSYLSGVQKPIYDFVNNNKIANIFGEVTWGHEMLILRITKMFPSLNCRYLSPHTVRMPSGHFAFFSDEEQSELTARSSGMDYEHIKITLAKPDYLGLNNQIVNKYFSLGDRIKRLMNFIVGKNHESDNPAMLHSKPKKLIKHLAREFNRELYRIVKKRDLTSCAENVRYVLYPLHKQPEASVDVIGRYYDDQYVNILNIWRALPDGWRLLVKEHSNAIGDRSIFFYNKVTRLHNVFLIGENEDSHKLIKNAQAVVTVSGTAAYEAALLGVPSFTFAKAFFNELALCHHLSIDQFKVSSLGEIIETSKRHGKDKMTLLEYEDWLSARIFKGVISDPDSNPACITPENLACVARGFKTIIDVGV